MPANVVKIRGARAARVPGGCRRVRSIRRRSNRSRFTPGFCPLWVQRVSHKQPIVFGTHAAGDCRGLQLDLSGGLVAEPVPQTTRPSCNRKFVSHRAALLGLSSVDKPVEDQRFIRANRLELKFIRMGGHCALLHLERSVVFGDCAWSCWQARRFIRHVGR